MNSHGKEERWRNLMPVCKEWVFLDHAAVGPLPSPSARAMRRWAEQAEFSGSVQWPSWNREVQSIHTLAASLIDAAEEEIGLVANTTTALNFIAEGIPWQPGDNVVTCANEFPSNLYPWQALASRGVEVRLVQPDELGRFGPDDVRPLLDAKTRLVSVSWVGFSSGFRADLGAICQLVHDHGALLCVDAIQGLGAFPISVTSLGIDFLAADGHKWLLGPEGAGILYVRKERLNLLRPTGLGWGSAVNPYAFDSAPLSIKPSAGRYEGGSLNMAGFLGLAESLRLLLELEPAWIAEQIRGIADYACDRLSARGFTIHSDRREPHDSGIISFSSDDAAPYQLRSTAKQRNVIISCRGGKLRISPHGYNNRNDIDRLIDALRGA